jgi:hypothetical protein
LLQNDFNHVRDYFSELDDVEGVAASSVDQTVDCLQFDSVYNAIHLASEIFQARKKRCLNILLELTDLLNLNYDREPFLSLVKSIVKRYDQFPPSLGIMNVISAYLSAVCVSTRPDSNIGVQNIINRMTSGQNATVTFPDEDPSYSVNDLMEDPIIRVFGPRNILSNINEDDNSNTVVPEQTLGQQSRSFSSFINSTIPMSPLRASYGNTTKMTPRLGNSLSTKPNKAMRLFREKAADFNGINMLGGLGILGTKKSSQKKMDEQTVETFRMLGLIDEKINTSPEVDERESGYDSDDKSRFVTNKYCNPACF